jgi:hypothetical protein
MLRTTISIASTQLFQERCEIEWAKSVSSQQEKLFLSISPERSRKETIVGSSQRQRKSQAVI